MKFSFKNIYILILGLLVLQLIFFLNFKFTAWPEMLLWPYLMTKGWLPYVNIAVAHTPHLLVDLFIFYKIFGVGIVQLKIFTWILIFLTDLLVYWISGRLWGKKIAVFSLGAFIFWQLFFDGNGLWFDLALAPLALLTFYLLNAKKYLWAGILWGIMFFTKQTAFWFIIPIIFELIRNTQHSVHRIKIFFFGTALIGSLVCVLLFAFHLLPGFYEWAIRFGIFVLPKSQGQIQLPDLKSLAVAVFPFLVFIPLNFNRKPKFFNLFLWSFAGALGAYPRFEFFHLQPAIPFLAFVSALVFSEFKKNKSFVKVFIAFYLIGSIYLFANFFIRNWGEGTRFFETDVQDLTSYVKANTKEGDKIFVMNWWDNLYALTGTLPAVDPWVPQLSWYQEQPGIQEKEIKDIRDLRPKMIILYPYSESGLSAYIPRKLYNYVSEHYSLKERVDNIEIWFLD